MSIYRAERSWRKDGGVWRWAFWFVLLSALFMSGCLSGTSSKLSNRPLSSPTALCTEPVSAACRPIPAAQSLLESPDLRILDSTATPGGQQGASVLTLRSSGGTVLRAKWRDSAAGGLMNILSDSRREVIAYVLQSLYLRPDEFVVPPTVPHCFPLDDYKNFFPEAEQTWPEVDCVFGYLSYWLSDVETVKASKVVAGEVVSRSQFPGGTLFIAERYARDPIYARKLARLNMLTFTVAHGDAHAEQFVVNQRGPFQVWSVDHSIALTSLKNPKALFEEDWSNLQVPHVPASLLQRMLAVTRNDVDRLALLMTFRIDEDRLIRVPNARGEQTLAEDFDLRVKGGVVQVGTTLRERDVIWSKFEELRQKVEAGELAVSP